MKLRCVNAVFNISDEVAQNCGLPPDDLVDVETMHRVWDADDFREQCEEDTHERQQR